MKGRSGCGGLLGRFGRHSPRFARLIRSVGAVALLTTALQGCALLDAPGAWASPDRTAAAAPGELPERQGPVGDAARHWPQTSVAAQRQMVVAAHPLAAHAGLQMLRQGGSALDAAIAAQLMLALVEPQSSGLGGGALLMHWDGQRVQAFDGRETAPAAAHPGLFLQSDGKPMPFMSAAVGGRAVGVPGAVRMLEMAHREHGRLPWAQLFDPAVQAAEQGFAIGPRLHAQLLGDAALRLDPQAHALFYRVDGTPWPVGTLLRNPALAQILRALAQQGSAALHQGPVAADLVARVRGHARNPGLMTAADLESYVPLEREPLCTLWKARWRVCGFPPPSSGHLALMQILGILEVLDLRAQTDPAAPGAQAGARAAQGLGSTPEAQAVPEAQAEAMHRYAEAARLALADRAAYVADPAFVAAPGTRWGSLLEPRYLAQRAALIGPRSADSAGPGHPGGQPLAWAPQAAQPEYGTSHISVVDAQGQAVALTSSIEAVFGARLMADGGTGLPGGYLLNNQLTDFAFAPTGAPASFAPTGPGERRVANRVEGGKRPRSSMSPTLVFDARSGALLMSLGSPLGAAIPHLLAKTLLESLGRGRDVQAAVNAPNFAHTGAALLLEPGGFGPGLEAALRERGHRVERMPLPSGIHVIARGANGWRGAADPRREGVVRAD